MKQADKKRIAQGLELGKKELEEKNITIEGVIDDRNDRNDRQDNKKYLSNISNNPSIKQLLEIFPDSTELDKIEFVLYVRGEENA